MWVPDFARYSNLCMLGVHGYRNICIICQWLDKYFESFTVSCKRWSLSWYNASVMFLLLGTALGDIHLAGCSVAGVCTMLFCCAVCESCQLLKCCLLLRRPSRYLHKTNNNWNLTDNLLTLTECKLWYGIFGVVLLLLLNQPLVGGGH